MKKPPWKRLMPASLNTYSRYTTVSKGLDDEVTAAPNTKRKIKALITQLSSGVRGLIQWRRRTGKVSASTSSRSIQTDPDIKKMSAEKRTTETQIGPFKENVEGVMLVYTGDTVPSPDHSRFELFASIEGVRQQIKTQCEVIGKLAEQVDEIQKQHNSSNIKCHRSTSNNESHGLRATNYTNNNSEQTPKTHRTAATPQTGK
jgi:hypothetical protein